MSRARDSQRAKFWKADAVINNFVKYPRLSRDDRERFLQSVCHSDWYQKNINANVAGKIPRYVTNKPYCLQYIAYRVIPSNAAWRGREMCEIYLMLVRRFLGVAASVELKAAFKANRVKFKPKRKMSETQIEAAKKRLIPFKNKFTLELEKL